MLDTLEKEPQVAQTEVFESANQQMSVAGIDLLLYKTPEDARYSMVGISNPGGFVRLMEGGLSALEDGESVHIATANEHDEAGMISNELYTITRMGDNFVMGTVYDSGEHPHLHTEDTANLEIKEGDKKISGFFLQEAFIKIGHRGMELVDRQDYLGETVRALGFVSEDRDAAIPMPQTLRANIARLREAGLQMPNIRFFTDAAIKGQDYVETWAAGEFPASEQPSYFAHDLLSEHFKPLVVYREDAMTVASLYAQAVLEAEEITFTVPATEYEINKARPELKSVTLSDQAKIDQAAINLDLLTSELANPLDNFDLTAEHESLEPAFTEHPPHHWRYMPQMVRTILDSPKRKSFTDHLEAIGSQALDPSTDEFSYETYLREIFGRAQDFWGIEPMSPTPNTKEPVARGMQSAGPALA